MASFRPREAKGGGNDISKARRNRVEPTDDREQRVLLCRWPEQAAYDEEIRPLVLFGSPEAERAEGCIYG